MSVMKRKIASARGVEVINLMVSLRPSDISVLVKGTYRNVSMNIVHDGGIKEYIVKSSMWSTCHCRPILEWREVTTHDADRAEIWMQSRLRCLKLLQRAEAQRLIHTIRKGRG